MQTGGAAGSQEALSWVKAGQALGQYQPFRNSQYFRAWRPDFASFRASVSARVSFASHKGCYREQP
jgi:hypothetical protein